MIQDFIYAGCRFKIKILNEKEYLVSMIKEKQLVEKFIVPVQEDITFYIENYLNIFYPKVVSNTTRKVRNS
jgi:hypothetical protein|tara:strand:+ start:223 stop:435 length:213 start_codon:yes stop_codon:yes gene_type:complete